MKVLKIKGKFYFISARCCEYMGLCVYDQLQITIYTSSCRLSLCLNHFICLNLTMRFIFICVPCIIP